MPQALYFTTMNVPGSSLRTFGLWVWLWLMPAAFCYAQPASFARVSTAQGLSDNLVYDACRDRQGLMWIATGSGLNSYNGYEVSSWHNITDSLSENRDVRGVLTDVMGRLWIRMASGALGMLTPQRKLIRPRFQHREDSGTVRFVLPSSTGVWYVLVKNKLLRWHEPTQTLQRHAVLPDSLMRPAFQLPTMLEEDACLLPGGGRLLKLQLGGGRITNVWKIPNIISAAPLPGGDLLVSTDRNRELFRLDPKSGDILVNYALKPDASGQPVNGYLRNMAVDPNGTIVITSGYGGLYFFDPATERLTNHRHDPLQEASVSGNNTFRVKADQDGYVFVTTRSSGLSYYRAGRASATSFRKLQEAGSNRIFDGFIGSLHQDRQGHYWLGSQGGLMRWYPATGQVSFLDYGTMEGEPLAGREEVRAIYADSLNRLWIGLNRFGVVMKPPSGNAYQYFNREAADSHHRTGSNFINCFEAGPNGHLLIAAATGLQIIDTRSLRVVPMAAKYPELQPLKKAHIFTIHTASDSSWWFGTSTGLWVWYPYRKELKSFSSGKGMRNKSIWCIAQDRQGNVYAGGSKGLDRLRPDGKLWPWEGNPDPVEQTCQNMVCDRSGRIWIGMVNQLACFDPATNRFSRFDASHGLLGSGFRQQAIMLDHDGRLLLGCNEGFTLLDPDSMVQQPDPFSIFAMAVQSGEHRQYLAPGDSIVWPYERRTVSFYLQPIALFSSKDWQVQYRLKGLDSLWTDYIYPQAVSFAPLPAGNYLLELRYRRTDGPWIIQQHHNSLIISKPWWQQWWARMLLAMAVATAVYAAYRQWRRRVNEIREAAETERVIHYLSNALHRHASVDDMLWDFTKNCIAELALEDCVIYLLQGDLLYQKAAWGPKKAGGQQVLNPLAIPLGKGIVGSVAVSGKPALVDDTAQDSRYIVDDQQRGSELCVPILAEGVVLGVIDSEHSRKRFFTGRHLTIFTTIASVLGSKLQAASVAAEKQATELALAENRQQTSEMEMKALRAQMNPHFMFNSLNSINNFILKSDSDNASAYLTRFARLMRLILDNSREEWITLDAELRALQLYVDMESLRFDHAFSFVLEVSPEVDPLGVYLPPMLLQPFVENAIWHGLLNRKETGSRLSLNISRNNGSLVMAIEDNGVGRQAAAAAKGKLGSHRPSHGMKITEERLAIMNRVYDLGANATITDLFDDRGQPAGTKVVITMKHHDHENNHY